MLVFDSTLVLTFANYFQDYFYDFWKLLVGVIGVRLALSCTIDLVGSWLLVCLVLNVDCCKLLKASVSWEFVSPSPARCGFVELID